MKVCDRRTNRFRQTFHLALAAFFAIAFRLAGESFSALAFPPLRPPRRPSATAAGFFSGGAAAAISWPGVPVDWATIRAASWFGSVGLGVLERLGMPER